MEPGEASNAALWGAVLLSGVYHGVNPGMGWPLAVSAALMERRRSALAKALLLLAVGHLLAMVSVLVPFALFSGLLAWERPVRLVAAGIAVGFGAYLLLSRRHHPRYLARVAPHRLVWWSFLAATAHGAGLMLLPIFLAMDHGAGAGGAMDGMEGHDAIGGLLAADAAPALLVAAVHTAAMLVAGGVLAVLVHRWLGLKAVSRTWFDLDAVWAVSLLVVGLLSGWAALR